MKKYETKIEIYVASSWRNDCQQGVVKHLRNVGFKIYDFKHPDGDETSGFSWKNINSNWKNWSVKEYIEHLNDEYAIAGFRKNMFAMSKSDVCVLVLPSGRSSHLEAGYFAQHQHRLLCIYIPEKIEPELMYKMANHVSDELESTIKYILDWESRGMP